MLHALRSPSLWVEGDEQTQAQTHGHRPARRLEKIHTAAEAEAEDQKEEAREARLPSIGLAVRGAVRRLRWGEAEEEREAHLCWKPWLIT